MLQTVAFNFEEDKGFSFGFSFGRVEWGIATLDLVPGES
jgi:hypothetical protein